MNTNKPARWFRLYAEFSTDPKVQMLSEVVQRRYLMILCLRCSNGDVTLHDSEVAFQLRISHDEWVETKRELIGKNLVCDDNKPVAWDRRQFASDTSAERVAAFRARQKKQCNVTVTTPETEKETETETENTKTRRDSRFNAHAHLLSLGVDESVAQDFIALRKQKRATVTLTALNGIEREAAKANVSLNAALEIVCARGWQSFKADWVRPEMLKHGDSKPDWAVEKENRMRAFAGDSAAKPQIQSTGNIIDITPQTKLIGG